MKPMKIFKTALLISIMALMSTTSFAAQRRHPARHHSHYRPAIVSVVARPTVISHVSNRLNKNDRLNMALKYLRNNKTLSISKYSKITGLTRATAEAELDAFAVSKTNPIKLIFNGKKKLYVIR